MIWQASSGDPSAPALVLIHGSFDRSAGLLKLSRRLDRTFAVTRFDRRGYGRSRATDGPFTAAANVSDLIDIVERARAPRGEPVVLVAHSFGGNVALAVAQQRPELVRAVVTYESPLSWLDWWPGASARIDNERWADDPEEAAERFVRRLIGDDHWDRLPSGTRAARRAEGATMIAELTDLRNGAPWVADRVGVPVLAIYGSTGSSHHRRAMLMLGEMLPDCEVAVVEGATHLGPRSHAGVVADLVVTFVGRVSGGPRHHPPSSTSSR